MAKCACGAETNRLRVTIHKDGSKTEICNVCKPDEFLTPEPAWMREKPALGWEAYPTEYRKKWHPDGRALYVATDESRVDGEAAMKKAATREYDEALERKRKTRRTTPMTKDEIAVAVKKAHELLVPEEQRKQEEYDRCMAQFKADGMIQ